MFALKQIFLNSKIRTKILVISGVLLAALLSLAIIALISATSINEELKLTNNDLIPGLDYARNLETNLVALRLAEMRYFSTADVNKRSEIHHSEINPLLLNIQETGKKYQGLINSNKEKSFFHLYESNFSRYRKKMDDAYQTDYATGLRILNKGSRSSYQAAKLSLENLASFNADAAERESLKSEALFRLLLFILSTITLFSFLGGVFLSLWFASCIGKPINKIREATQFIAEGNLSHEICDVETHDELGELTVLLNAMSLNLKQLIGKIQENAATVASSADALLNTAVQMSESATDLSHLAQNSSVVTSDLENNIKTVVTSAQESSASMQGVYNLSEKEVTNNKQVSNAIEQMSTNMDAISTSIEEISQIVSKVAESTQEMSVSLEIVRENSAHASSVAERGELAAGETRRTIASLEEKANQIGSIISIIQGISSQVNLLALNATIEAASAGEYGKGFAVVANEVKELAKQTEAATANIRGVIEDMQTSTIAAIKANDEIAKIITEINSSNHTIAELAETQAQNVGAVNSKMLTTARELEEVSGTTKNISIQAKETTLQVQESFARLQEIAQTIESASNNSEKIAKNIKAASTQAADMADSVKKVDQTSLETAEKLSGIRDTASALTGLSAGLNNLVASFKL